MTHSAIRELLKVTEQPGCISFAGGLPSPDAFPLDEVAEVTQRILRDSGTRALQYGPTEGYRPLRAWIAEHYAPPDVTLSAENVLITTGSQQGLDLLGKIFLDPGDVVGVESPTYLAALQAWTAYEVEFAPIPSDHNGMQTSRLNSVWSLSLKFIYCQPNFQNPTGVTLTLSRREKLVAATAQRGIPIIEDDPYHALRFDGEHLPTLLSLAGRRQGGDGYAGHVIALGTFSKILSPGIRVGWIIAPEAVIHKLTLAKQGVDLHTAMLNQMIAYEMAHTGLIEQHIPAIIQMYRERRDAMLAALATHFPASVRWTMPQGGMFVWVYLPEQVDAASLLETSLEEQPEGPGPVAFVPGGPFHTQGGANTLRLNFSHSDIPTIHEGISRLGLALKKHLAVPALS
jgi:2-aminoadipate transaminase